MSSRELNVGDVIVSIGPLGTTRYPIDRVTAKYAFSRLNRFAEAKFLRTVDDFWGVLPSPRRQWDTTRRTVEWAAREALERAR